MLKYSYANVARLGASGVMAAKAPLSARYKVAQITKGTGAQMRLDRHLYVRIRKSAGGQTMAEYALILLAVALVAFASYQTFGTTISADVVAVNPLL